jgi:hypothetical protein
VLKNLVSVDDIERSVPQPSVVCIAQSEFDIANAEADRFVHRSFRTVDADNSAWEHVLCQIDRDCSRATAHIE